MDNPVGRWMTACRPWGRTSLILGAQWCMSFDRANLLAFCWLQNSADWNFLSFFLSCCTYWKKKQKSTEKNSPRKTVVWILLCDLPNHSLVSLSLLLSSNRSWSWVDGGGGEWWARHLWPFAAFCGLYYPCVIVLRDVDNHNRRRAGKPQSSGRNEGQLMVGGGKKNVTFIVCMGKREGMGDGKEGLSWVFCTNSGFVVVFLVGTICSLTLNRTRGRLWLGSKYLDMTWNGFT